MISTKNVGGSGFTPKTLQPGSQTIKVNSVSLGTVPFSATGFTIDLQCEGPDLGETFEGFWIDKDNQAKGKHKGQVGRVRSSRYVYEDANVNGKEIKRDDNIVRFLNNLADVTGCMDWMEKMDGKFETIEEFVKAFNNDAPFKDVYFNVVLGGKEYENSQGYTNFDLFIPKFTRDGVPMEEVGKENSRLIAYNEEEHIIRKTPKVVEEFSGEEEAADDDFNLED